MISIFRIRFAGWFTLATFLHAAATVWLLVADFTSGLAGKGGSDPNWLLALWTPPAMYLWESTERSASEGWLLLLGAGWSAVMGVAGAFFLSWLFPGKEDEGSVFGYGHDAIGTSQGGNSGSPPDGEGDNPWTDPIEYVMLISFPFVLAGIFMIVVRKKMSPGDLFFFSVLALAVCGVLYTWLKAGKKPAKMVFWNGSVFSWGPW